MFCSLHKIITKTGVWRVLFDSHNIFRGEIHLEKGDELVIKLLLEHNSQEAGWCWRWISWQCVCGMWSWLTGCKHRWNQTTKKDSATKNLGYPNWQQLHSAGGVTVLWNHISYQSIIKQIWTNYTFVLIGLNLKSGAAMRLCSELTPHSQQ